ncbi:MAG: DUF6537 domain-containing protein [Pseudomonadota bacterium]
MSLAPLRILITALGGQGGGTLMNWLVTAARNNDYRVQATSVPGVAQRTGSTSYYIELADKQYEGVFNLVPMPARVDVVICSEWIEAARVIEAGLVSPQRTTLIASTNRVYSTAEKIHVADGRFDMESVEQAAQNMAKHYHLLDLQQLASDHGTYISATMYGAVAASGALPWGLEQSRRVLSDSGHSASAAGFDAAATAVSAQSSAAVVTEDNPSVETLINYAVDELTRYQDVEYAALYRSRLTALFESHAMHTELKTEVARRLANWMMYEDIPRVADLKTRPERYRSIAQDCRVEAGQTIRITEYLKPRIEEIADMLPVDLGKKILQRAADGKSLPFIGSGRRIPSNSAWGYWLLRATAAMKKLRRRSLRFHHEQTAIEQWLNALQVSVAESPEFAMALATLPRVRKGYSDTLQRGLMAYDSIFDSLVSTAIDSRRCKAESVALELAIEAALKDENHTELKEAIVKFHHKDSLQTQTVLP